MGVNKDGVILLHGIARSAHAMRRMERALQAAGYRTFNVDYPGRKETIASLADRVEQDTRAFVDGILGEVHFVTHSMGGLVARSLIARRRPAKLGRVVMLGPPSQGSEIADLLVDLSIYKRVFGPAGQELTTWAASHRATAEPVDFPLGIVAGSKPFDLLSWALLPKPNDGKVSVARTKLAGMADHITLRATHAFMMHHPAVIRAVLAYLETGRFARSAPMPTVPEPSPPRFAVGA